MKKELATNKVELSIKADKSLIKNDGSCERILEISITPPVKQSSDERPALNLSLVLDRSGSMSGDKLHYVKKAAAHVIDLMEEKDRISVVVYDDRVETLVPLGNVTEEFKRRAKQSLQNVRSGNSTFLSGGWLRGCELAAEGATPNSINRTLLLTDGLANVGIRDADQLAFHAREIYQRGISTSCFGVGEGYDEHLLEGMSNNGGGSFHYLETMNAIPLIFEREFDELIAVTLRDVELKMKLPQGVKAQVFAGWSNEATAEHLAISLGSLFSGKCQRVFVKLQFDRAAAGSGVTIPITVRGKADGDYICDATQTFTFTPAAGSEVEAAAVDQALMERFAEVDMADRANEALKMERAGDRRGASQLMQSSIAAHKRNLSAEMTNKFEFMTNEMAVGMSEESRKRHHQEEYENRRGRERIRYYMLDIVGGHLVALIESQKVLIDTGVPISIGRTSEFYFMNQAHPLSPEYMGVTLKYLEKMVGTKIDCMMGADILKKYYVSVDIPEHRIFFSDQLLMEYDTKIPLTDFMGSPIAVCEIDGSEHQVFIDTGAKLSYVTRSAAANLMPISREKDFYPGLGEFETDVFQVPMKLGKVAFELRCGVLPDLLETTLLVTGKSGIIGTELFEKFRACLALPIKTMFLQKN